MENIGRRNARRAVDILAWDVSVPEDHIRIRVQHGWITLSGEVDWYFQRQAAEHAVRKLNGVIGVNNMITIKPEVQPTDVKKHIEDALKRNAELEANSIRVSVTGSKVTLEGNVKAWHERQLAERAAWAARGVTTVEDRIQVG